MPVYSYKTKKGIKYYFKVSIQNQPYLRRGFEHRRDAILAESVFLTDNAGKKLTKMPTYRELMKKYFYKLSTNRKNAVSTINHKKRMADCHILEHFKSDVPIDKLKQGDFSNFKNYINNLHSKYETKLKICYLFKYVFDFAYEYYNFKCPYLGKISDYVIKQDSDREAEPKRIFEVEDFIKLVSVADDFDGLLYLTLFETAMRIGELLQLRVNDLEDGKLYIRHDVKTISSKRYLFLTPTLCEKLQNHIKRYRLKDYNYIFFSSNRKGPKGWKKNKRLDLETVYKRLKKYISEAGIQHITPHYFRRTGLTVLHESGIPLEYLKDYAGHTSIAITKQYYIKETDDHKKKIRDILEEAESKIMTKKGD